MGFFSSIKKTVSKTWSGVKKAVKGVAKTVKTVAKKVAYAIPGGKQLWDFGSKVGKGIMKGIGKITSKLGPIGTMALSFVLAPVMGPALGALWSGFGAGAAGMASSANVFVSALGHIGTGIYGAVGAIGNTISTMGDAIAQGASKVVTGDFSGGLKAFATNMGEALSGNAAKTGWNQALATASTNAGTVAADAASQLTESQAMSLAQDGVVMQSPVADTFDLGNAVTGAPTAVQSAAQAALNSSPVATFDLGTAVTGGQQMTTAALDAQVAKYGMTAAQMNAIPNAANAFITNGSAGTLGIAESIVPKAPTAGVVERAQQMKSLLGGGGASQDSGFTPYVPKAIQSAQLAKPSNVNGTGSAGFSLLGGVQGLEESLRRSQSLMFG